MKRNLGPNSYLKNSNSNELVRGQQTDAWWTNGFTGYWVNFFDLIAALTFAVSILFPLPILILGMSMFVLAKFVKAVFYFQYIDPVIAALGYSASLSSFISLRNVSGPNSFPETTNRRDAASCLTCYFCSRFASID